MNAPAISSIGDVLDDIRHGRMVVILDEREGRVNEGVVMVAAEHCEAAHITFMARRARGLVCLALTQERCLQLDLPPMVAGGDDDAAQFTLSIEAAHGIDTGRISSSPGTSSPSPRNPAACSRAPATRKAPSTSRGSRG